MFGRTRNACDFLAANEGSFLSLASQHRSNVAGTEPLAAVID